MGTAALAEAICGTDSASFPEAARRIAHLALMDSVGVALAGSLDDASRIAREVTLRGGGAPQATIWGNALRAPTLDAVLNNGVAVHVLDFDDANYSMFGHPTAPLAAALFGVAEERGLPGRAIIEAYIVGVEVGSRLGVAMNLDHYERGWHTTSTLGTIGVAAAVGRLLGLEHARITAALAIAASLSSGLVRNFGSMTKALHVGHAARSGVLAAYLAESGYTGNPEVLESEDGFVEIFSGRTGAELARAIASWGQPWDLVEPGLDFKLYPSCTLTHPPLDAALALREAHAIDPAAIASIHCYGNYRIPLMLTYHEPVNSLQAKFSLEYSLAVAFLDGAAGLAQYSDGRVMQPDVQALLRRVRFYVDPSLTTRESLKRDSTRLRVEMKDGRAFETQVGKSRGHPENPVKEDVLTDKFLSCATCVLPPEQARLALRLLLGLDEVENAREVTRALAIGAEGKVVSR